MKKKTPLLIAAVLAAQLPLNVFAYSDTDGHWANRFIIELSNTGIVDKTDGNFRPDDKVNVNEFLKMVISAMNIDIPSYNGGWASGYIAEAEKRKLVYPGEFEAYDRPITRGEIAKIVVRAINADKVPEGSRPGIIAKISDYYDIYNEYKEYVLAAYANQLMNGYEDNTFRIFGNSTRAEACVVINRMIQVGSFEKPGGGDMPPVRSSNLYFVSVDGSDSGDGSETSPFRTLEKARDSIREVISSGAYPDGGITVCLRGGDYELDKSFELTAADSGTEKDPVVYTSYQGETARITGSRKLNHTDFKPISKPMGDKLIDKSAANKVLEIDLTKQGIADLGELSRRGFLITANVVTQPELYIDGSRQQLSRWPNSEWVGTTDIVRSGARSQQGVLEGAVYKIDYDRPMRWKTNINEIYTSGVLGPNYFYGYFPLDKIEQGQITLREGSVTSYYSKHFIRYENIFEELDEPGEYYIDRTSGMMYFYPTDNFGENSDIRLSVATENLIGASNVKNVTLKNLKIDGTRLGGVRAEDVDRFTIENCEISGTGAAGIYIRGTHCTVKNSSIHDIGATGISMNGGDYNNVISAENAITNNHIYRAAQIERSYQAGISLGYQSVGAVVSHNEIHDMPHAAVIIYGPDHTVEYNDIYDAVKEFHDMDAIYLNVNQYPWERNVVIRRNFIHDLGQQTFTERQMNVAGIRTDNHGNGLEVVENVFYNIGYKDSNGIRGVCAQGIENVVNNNIFVDTAGTFEGEHVYNPAEKWNLEDASVKTIYNQWQHYSPKYSEKNPEVAGFFDHYYTAYEKNNSFKGNVVVNIKFPLSTANHVPSAQGFLASEQLVDASDNIVTSSDPGFVDYNGGNFALKEDSDVYKKISDFPKLDFENIGLISGDPVGVLK